MTELDLVVGAPERLAREVQEILLRDLASERADARTGRAGDDDHGERGGENPLRRVIAVGVDGAVAAPRPAGPPGAQPRRMVRSFKSFFELRREHVMAAQPA